MIISFGKTQHLLSQKSVTRRNWSKRQRDTLDKAWREGRHRHKAYDRNPRNGGQQIGWLTLTQRPYRETLEDMPQEDLILEGGDCQTVQAFAEKYFNGNLELTVTVIRFHYEAIAPAPVPVGHTLGPASIDPNCDAWRSPDPGISDINFSASGELTNSPFGIADFGDPFAPPEDFQSPHNHWAWLWTGQIAPLRWGLGAALATGTAAVVVWVARSPATSTATVYHLGNECLQVTNAEGVVQKSKLQSLASLVGKPINQLNKTLGQTPYCGLPATSMLSGAVLNRSLYQLEGDRQMVVAFENDRLVGYEFYPPEDGNFHGTGKRHDFSLRQNWSWLSGSTTGSWTVVGGLGTIALSVDGPVFAPDQGKVLEQSALATQGQLSRLPDSCTIFSSLKLPGYVIELCGLSDRQVGAVDAGQIVGHADTLHLGLLRRTNQQWMYVPPSTDLVQQLLDKSVQPSQS